MKNLYTYLFAFYALLAGFQGKAQTPLLESYPSATATIYLDFDGHLVEGTSWNSNGPISCGPSNLNNAQVTEIYNRIAEDYRPFNINITTDSTKYWAAPVTKRMRLVLTVTSDWYGPAGGVSFVGSFGWGDNTPCFVFTALLNYNAKSIAEAGAHEIGHTLGLRHQSSYDGNCIKLSEYNSGTGSGEIGWAPIMGVGYYRNFTLWNNGANPYGCTNYQDDLGIITSPVNDIGFRTDDHPNLPQSGSTLVNFTNNQFDATGVIERISDEDVFRFTLPVTGGFHLDGTPFNIGNGDLGSNLDMQVQLYDAGMHLVDTYNPELQLNVMLDTLLPAGTYYIGVKGKGNIYAPEYASLGSYTLKGSFKPTVLLPLRKLELEGKKEQNAHLLNWTIDADEAVIQQVIETSLNGTNFQAVANPANSSRMFSNSHISNALTFYRLRVKFDNGQQYYSNTIRIPADGAARPKLVQNLVQSTIQVNTVAKYSYAIVDYSGRLVAKGNLPEGNTQISVSNLSRGMYMIHFMDGKEETVERFMKQ